MHEKHKDTNTAICIQLDKTNVPYLDKNNDFGLGNSL